MKEIKRQIHIPLVADIHFDYHLAIAAMENGADKIRINPGNIGGPDTPISTTLVCSLCIAFSFILWELPYFYNA